jgi:Ca2+-binding RTX toxin-like protein
MKGSIGVVVAILCGVAALALPGIARADIGFQGPAYAAGTSGSPSGSKPESKLWWNDGFWWASMFHPASNQYRIFRLNLRPQTWSNTGVALDPRPSSRADVLSVGNRLFVASHKVQEPTVHDPTPSPDDSTRLYRYSYNPATNRYSQEGFTVIDAQRSEALVIDHDSNGAIWATWVQQDPGGQHRVYVKKTSDNCVSGPFANCAWTTAVELDNQVSADDISSLVRFGGNKIGVMWSDTSDTSPAAIAVLRFAFHVDGDAVNVWSSETVVSGSKAVDDHINLKADSVGGVYAVTKTKFTSAANPGTRLHRRTTTGVWSTFMVSNASLGRTRPILLLDQQHNRIRVFEGRTNGTTIYMKTSRLNAVSFPTGSLGTPVIQDVGGRLSNPTSTKQNITNGTRQIVVATNPLTRRYWHGYQQIIPCINGTAGNNLLIGTNGNDVICGLGGRDTIRGLNGNDRLAGGPGNDTLVGGTGRDTFVGGADNDTIYSRDALRELVSGGSGFDQAQVNLSDIRRSIERLL